MSKNVNSFKSLYAAVSSKLQYLFNATIWEEALCGKHTASRRADRAPGSEAGTARFDFWRAPRAQAAGIVTAVVATGYGVGYAIQQPVLGSPLGIVAGAIFIYFIISRAPEMSETT